jgi:hypothetical protein
MSGVLTFLTAVLGAALVVTGWASWFRARMRGAASLTRRARRRAWAFVAVGGLLALVPELPSALLGALPDRPWPVVLLLVVYRMLVVVGLVAVVGTITLAHERVTTPAGRLVGDVRSTVVRSVPFGPGRGSRTLRRELAVPDFPAGWDDVVELDRRLATRLMAYERDEHARADRPAMRDFGDPVTRTAYEAMLAADALRSNPRPPAVVDALRTPYGRAVAGFQVALERAEANAAARATAHLSPAEQDAIGRAEQTLAFLQDNSASAAEREQAYADLAAQLDAARASSAESEPADRSHPWLDVTERATR